MTPVLQYLQSEIYACIFYFLSNLQKLSCLNLFQKKKYLYKKMLEGRKSPNVISHKSRNNNDV